METHKLAKTWTFVAFELHLACVDLKKKLELGRGWRFRGLVLVIYYINLTRLIFQGREEEYEKIFTFGGIEKND